MTSPPRRLAGSLSKVALSSTLDNGGFGKDLSPAIRVFPAERGCDQEASVGASSAGFGRIVVCSSRAAAARGSKRDQVKKSNREEAGSRFLVSTIRSRVGSKSAAATSRSNHASCAIRRPGIEPCPVPGSTTGELRRNAAPENFGD